MKIFTQPVTCSVCGGPAMARGSVNTWTSSFVHADPLTCQFYVRELREKLEKEKASLSAERDSLRERLSEG